MNRAYSLYLDLVRASAAIVVLISHFAYPRFSEGRYLWARELNLGSDAVVVFFVLSGLIIAFSASTKDASFGSFAFNRATRILSVALPALVLGFVLDRSGAVLFPEAYDGWFYNPVSLTQTLLVGLSFSNEWAWVSLRLGTNGPYWSMSYEVAYYALFAVAFYLSGLRRVALLGLLVLCVGLNILLLMPAWLLGVWLWGKIRTGQLPTGLKAISCAVLPCIAYVWAQSAGLPDTLAVRTADMVGADYQIYLRFSDEFLWNGLLGLCFAVHLLGMAGLLAHHEAQGQGAWIRSLAGASFSIYLFHYPLLQFLAPALPALEAPLARDSLLFGVTLITCLALAQLFERTLPQQRALLKGLLNLRGQNASA